MNVVLPISLKKIPAKKVSGIAIARMRKMPNLVQHFQEFFPQDHSIKTAQ